MKFAIRLLPASMKSTTEWQELFAQLDLSTPSADIKEIHLTVCDVQMFQTEL